MKKIGRTIKKKSWADLAEKAIKEAFRDLVIEKRKVGGSLVFWKNNKVVHVPASQVSIS
jgi:hypothetical protein